MKAPCAARKIEDAGKKKKKLCEKRAKDVSKVMHK